MNKDIAQKIKHHERIYKITAVFSLLVIIDLVTNVLLSDTGGLISLVLAQILKYALFFLPESTYFSILGVIISLSRVLLIFFIVVALVENNKLKKLRSSKSD